MEVDVESSHGDLAGILEFAFGSVHFLLHPTALHFRFIPFAGVMDWQEIDCTISHEITKSIATHRSGAIQGRRVDTMECHISGYRNALDSINSLEVMTT